MTIDIDQGQVSNATYALINSVTVVPNAAFTFADQGGGRVNFTDNSTNEPISWAWDFGDSSTSTDQNPSHTFAGPGTYNVCLMATNSAGSNRTCSEITIVLAPVAAFSFSVQEGGLVDNSAGANTACQEVDAMVTSTNDIGHLINLTIAPNPVKDLLNIRLESDDFSQLRFRLISPIGQVVLERQLQSNQDHQFNLKELPQGTYFYLLTNEMGQLGSRGSIQKME